MVSMVIVLFLVAVVIFLFVGRLAETLTDRYRASGHKGENLLNSSVSPWADVVENEVRVETREVVCGSGTLV